LSEYSSLTPKGNSQSIWSISSVWFIWFLWFVLFNQTNETNQSNEPGPGGGFQHRLVDSHHRCLIVSRRDKALQGNLSPCRIAMLARALRLSGQETGEPAMTQPHLPINQGGCHG
jgi:hypothetical protein